jgi:hypothetical protein
LFQTVGSSATNGTTLDLTEASEQLIGGLRFGGVQVHLKLQNYKIDARTSLYVSMQLHEILRAGSSAKRLQTVSPGRG